MRFLFPVLLLSAMMGSLSAREETGVIIQRDIPFLGEGRKETLDLYLPPEEEGTSGLRPAILIVHGGGWHGGSKRAARENNIGTNLAGAGYVCASIDYRLAKKKTLFTDNLRQVWPGNLHDCMTAVRFLRARAGDFRIDPDKIGAIGGSAGGHLVAMLGAVSETDDLYPKKTGSYPGHSSRIQAVIPMYGVYDLIGLAKEREMLTAMNDVDQAMCREASPVTHADGSDPPVLLLHGTKDHLVPVSQTVSYQRVLEKAGVRNEMLIIEGAPHSFHLQPKQRDLRSLVIGFFDDASQVKTGSLGSGDFPVASFIAVQREAMATGKSPLRNPSPDAPLLNPERQCPVRR